MKRFIAGNLMLAALIGISLINSTPALADCPSADYTDDCFVDIDDLVMLSGQWLDTYDLNDFALLSNQWHTGDRIQGIVNSVSRQAYETFHRYIENSGLGLYGGPAYNQGYRNRDGWAGLGTLGNQEARLYITDQFTSIGLTTSIQGIYLNVIGELTGTTTPEKVYIIGGHYDHISGDSPGGDDNASGTAGVLEAARILSQYKFESTIRFICFNAEEDGMRGSYDYLDNLTTTQKNNIKGMINLDMILRPGSDDNPDTVIDLELETSSNAYLPWIQAYQKVIADYVPSLVVGDIFIGWSSGSDNDSFQDVGIPAFLVIENSWGDWYPQANPYYHSYEDATDRLANSSPNGITYDFPFAANIVRASVALIAQQAVLQK